MKSARLVIVCMISSVLFGCARTPFSGAITLDPGMYSITLFFSPNVPEIAMKKAFGDNFMGSFEKAFLTAPHAGITISKMSTQGRQPKDPYTAFLERPIDWWDYFPVSSQNNKTVLELPARNYRLTYFDGKTLNAFAILTPTVFVDLAGNTKDKKTVSGRFTTKSLNTKTNLKEEIPEITGTFSIQWISPMPEKEQGKK